MLGNFSYHNPTKLYFGDEALGFLGEELPKYGKTVQLIYGGGSIKRNGLYDEIIEILKSNGKTVVEDAGVMPNPTVEKLREGVKIARENNVDLLLAVGGGSCCDYAKAVSVSVHCDDDPWEKYYLRFEEPDCEIVPVGCVLTMAGTGSEMNGGAVITNHAQKLKIGHVFGDDVMPKFSILNPKYTMTLPKRQMVAGIDAPTFGEGKNSWLTGTAAWTFLTVSQAILGITPDYDGIAVDPCIPSSLSGYTVTRRYRGAEYHITVDNAAGVQKGIASVTIDGEPADVKRCGLFETGCIIPAQPAGSVVNVKVVMG